MRWRAFEGPNWWYVAVEDADGYHRRPAFPCWGVHGRITQEEEARAEAHRRNEALAARGER